MSVLPFPQKPTATPEEARRQQLEKMLASAKARQSHLQALDPDGQTATKAAVAAILHQLRDLREDQGIPSDDFASALGLTPSYLATLEAGDHNPSLTLVGLMARRLGVRLSLEPLDPQV